MSIKVEFHGIESNGVCSLSGKEGEVLLVSFADGTLVEAPLSQKSLVQLLRMKLAPRKPVIKPPKPEARPDIAIPTATPAK